MVGKKRLFLAAATLASVGAVVALATGVTFGLFSASQTSSGSSFTAGTVALPPGDTVDTTCTVSPMVPGDSSTGYLPVPTGQTDTKTAACTFSVEYTGNVPAFIGIKLTSGGTGLYDGTANGLQYEISDGSASYATAGVLNSTTQELYVSTDAASSDTVHTFTVNYALPNTNADNGYQGETATLGIAVSAVQAGNNGTAAACTAGSTCPGITAWS
jgi:predicted ribosomally synthesized peptide with SipW-like signal peptide